MGDDLRGQALSLEDNHEFITDCARYADGLLSEQDVKKKYRFDDDTWARLGENDTLVEAIEAEKTRRIHNGSSARERAQQLFATAPNVLGDILHGDAVSPRHKIESVRELRQIAANGPEATPATDRFQIIINLGADVVERYDKSIAVNPNDVDPFNDVGATPQGLLTVIAAKKKDDGGGESIERLNRGRPTTTKIAQEPSPAQKLLDWLQNWAKPIVSARDICIYGPNSLRDRRRAIDSAEILVKHGWLIPNKTRRRDMHEWQIVRKPIIHPTVATE